MNDPLRAPQFGAPSAPVPRLARDLGVRDDSWLSCGTKGSQIADFVAFFG
jgi:hypothetical protein